MANKGLIHFHHADIAKSTDGSPPWSADDVLFGPGDTDRFKPDFNQLFSCNCSHLLVALRNEGDDYVITAASYPGTPDLRWAVQPWRGRYLDVQMGIYVSSGSGTVSVRVGVEAPVSTENLIWTHSTAITTGPVYAHLVADLSTLAGTDRRGLDGFLNIYAQVTGGATGRLTGLSAYQHNVSGRTLW